MSLYKNCGWWKNSDCIFEFSMKSYVTNTINLSCAKILLPSLIDDWELHEDITTQPLLFSSLQIILSFWQIVNITCFLVRAITCLPISGFSEAIKIGKWAQHVQITQDKNHGISCHWWNFWSHSWDCFPQVPNYEDFKIISCQIKGILLYYVPCISFFMLCVKQFHCKLKILLCLVLVVLTENILNTLLL